MIEVTAAVIIENGKVFLAQRGDGDRLAGMWEFPGGEIEEGESPEECLAREMHEEFGMDINVGPFFMENIHEYDFAVIRLLFYECSSNDDEIMCHEHAQWRWVPFNELSSLSLAPADVPAVQKLLRDNFERRE